MLGHVLTVLYLDCDYDKRPQWTLVVYLLSHILLFTNFYRRAYSRPRKQKPVESETANREIAAAANGNIAAAGNKKDN